MEKKDTTLEQEEIKQVQEAHEADYDIGLLEDILVHIPDDWWQESLILQNI